ncbi:ferrochelatase [Fastidiosibacter lacustris]|uniref:ferrochelatase n=1 Tax=Fastidiosibacter lacustris TaxID=2056695 RepID=UPI000E345F83|nr:ferrochelatase [Fastidiosibacter lacustris]
MKTVTSQYREYDKYAVLLVNLGTPDSYTVKDVKQYLKQFLSDRRVIELTPLIWQLILRLLVLPFRSPKTAKLYQKVWLKEKNLSPLMYYTQMQTKRLAQAIDNDVIVDFAMRYGEPSIEAKIHSLQAQGVTTIKVFPLYPQYSATTTASVYDEVFRVLKKMRNQPNIIGVKPYYAHPQYIEALKKSVLTYIPKLNFAPDIILFSFHGIPKQCVDKGDPYYWQCQETYRLVKNALSNLNIELRMSFQSRFGPKKWLSPYTTDVLKILPTENKNKILLVTPGFAADCLETLEELNETERKTFLQAGGTHYAVMPCLNDSDEHMELLKTLAK